MKKILLGFFSFGLISLLFFLKPISANAASDFVVANASICYNSRTLYNNPYGHCYNGNWRFNTSVKNIGDSSNANEPGVVNPDYDYGYHNISSFNYGLSNRFFFQVSNIILAPGERRDFYQTVSGLACDEFGIVAVGNVDANWNWKVTDIDSVGPCPLGPTPTPLPSCPYTFSQIVSKGAYNLGTGYSPSASVLFTPPFSAGVKVIEVSAGTWSGSATLTCKLEAPGPVLLGETTSPSFSGGGTWRALTFPLVMNLTSGTTYTLYCRKTLPPNFSAYWNFDTGISRKTYKFHLDYCPTYP